MKYDDKMAAGYEAADCGERFGRDNRLGVQP